MSNYHSLIAMAVPADMDQERLPSLFLKLETAVLKKLKTLPASAPIALQMTESIFDVKAELAAVMDLTGRPAVEAFLRAIRDHFTSDFPPLRALARRYPNEIVVDTYEGTMSLKQPVPEKGPPEAAPQSLPQESDGSQ